MQELVQDHRQIRTRYMGRPLTMIVSMAVSYTHLDVYKRQAYHRAADAAALTVQILGAGVND